MSLTFANKITICRILAVPFFIAAVFYDSPDKDYLRWTALGIFLFAVISDAIDGYVARTFREKTKAGAILDPLADKLLLMSAFICLYYKGSFWHDPIRFPGWIVIAVISRDLFLVVGGLILYLVQRTLDVAPTFWGKSTTFLQVVSVIGIFLQWPFSFIIWDVMLVFTFISAVDYIRTGMKVLNTGGIK
ncbi:MAG: CDP-alcohol phosphatidyltransferase family protein [Candidatus Omnitrophica bacterium]|nr:CDP-alcohol phosphatidyltransferase family protein [Candidatus Omnitrophota bacterium]